MLGVQSCEISFSSTLEGGGRIRTSSRSRKMKMEFAVLNIMYRLRLPMSTIHHICEFRYATAQSKDDDLTEHYEFKWCLRSPCGCRLLMQSGTQYHNDVLKTRCEEQANLLLSNMRASVYACFGKAAIVRPRAPPPGRQASQAREKLGWGPLLQLQQPPRGDGPTGGGNTPPRGDQTKNGPPMCNATPGRQLVKETAHHCTAPFHFPRVLAVIPTRTRLLAKFVMFR